MRRFVVKMVLTSADDNPHTPGQLGEALERAWWDEFADDYDMESLSVKEKAVVQIDQPKEATS